MYRQTNIADSETCYNCIDDDTDYFGNPDNLFGRNKQKKAEKKIKKAEKALAKGQIKKAARKMKKATPILNKIAAQQQNIIGAKQQLSDINTTKQVIDATSTGETESPYTDAGQIGSEAGAVTYGSRAAQTQTLAGSSGDISGGGGGGDFMEDIYSTANEGGETGLTADTAKELQGVTVTAKKTNWLLIGGIAIGAIVLVMILMKSLKK
jgi:hypothetical protein